jgi:hypothetical protein
VTRPTRANRELACLALGHEDGDAAACPSSDDELLAALVQEVQRLRVAAGEIDESPVDEAERIGAVVDALADTDAQWLDERARAAAVVDWLVEDGWQLARRRP